MLRWITHICPSFPPHTTVAIGRFQHNPFLNLHSPFRRPRPALTLTHRAYFHIHTPFRPDFFSRLFLFAFSSATGSTAARRHKEFQFPRFRTIIKTSTSIIQQRNTGQTATKSGRRISFQVSILASWMALYLFLTGFGQEPDYEAAAANTGLIWWYDMVSTSSSGPPNPSQFFHPSIHPCIHSPTDNTTVVYAS